jgi:DNA-binding XRE family transcriptional regulator
MGRAGDISSSQPMPHNTFTRSAPPDRTIRKAHGDAKTLFGKNVRLHRHAIKLSQEALALKIGADQAYISRIEAGKLNPTLETIAEIAKALDIDIKQVFDE